MATAAKNVMVIQDASKTLNLRVFYWIINALSLEPEDMVTLVAILHEVHTPMGYRITVDNRLIGVNQRIVEKELAKKKEEYLNNEGLAQIVKNYESKKVAFKIKLFPGSSPKGVALEVATSLKATWVILDRYMKKDEEFFLQNLSCGISILKRNNRIVRLRGPIDLPDEIQCNSHETYNDESLPSVPYKDLFNIDVFAQGTLEDDEQNQIQSRSYEEGGCSNITININEKTCQPSHHNLSMDGTENSEMTDKIERDEQGQEHEQIQTMPRETAEEDATIMVKNDQTTHDPDGEEEKCVIANSVCTSCSVCKTRRPSIMWFKEFTHEELEAVTDGFSLKNCLSGSGSLFTFQGQMEGGMKLVVKRHDVTNTQVREKVKSEIQTILKVRHNNVIMLLGSSTAESFLFTAYEYACNGSLDKYLSKESTRTLAWIERKRVVIGIARGLKYLHDNNIVHCNIKPSNILLTHDFKPLIGDFGFGKEFELKSYKNKNKGNNEYIAPEYREKRKLSNKTDVYSFGVIILEMITGRRTTDFMSEDKSLVEWAKPLLKRKNYSELVDPIIRNSYEEDHLRWLVQVTTQCLKKNPKERFSMNMVVSSLQGIADSEICHMTEDITQAISDSDSRIVPDINSSQGPTTTKTDQQSQEEEQIESRFYGEENKLTLKIENNQFYTIEEQMKRNDLVMDPTVVDHLSEFEEHIPNTKGDQLSQDQEEESNSVELKIAFTPEPISEMIVQTKEDEPVPDKTQMQHENLPDGLQGEIVSENNSKSSACSICKSRRPNDAWPQDFTYEELLEATEGFSVENSLSESEDGPTFEGMLERHVKIVVKKHQIAMFHEEKIFKSEVQLLIKARHKNVAMLLGLCTNESQLMIVYEQVCNGSLEQYLTRGSFQSLTWKQRLKVAMGTARGLKYLHGNDIIHGNIKPSNILLTHDFEPLIGDFGFEKVKLGPKKSCKYKCVRNYGYAAPEYLENGKLSNKSDVFSFGVVLLELISGRRAMDKLPGGKSLVGWARPLLGGKKYPQLVDLKISNSYEEEKLLWLVQVTEKCLRKNPKERLTMNMVVSSLQGIEESTDCCIIEDHSPEKSYLPHDDPSMISTQGQVKDHPVKQEQECIDRNQYEEERSLGLTVKTNDTISQRNADQLIEVQSSNDMIDQINPEQQIQEKQHINGICDEDLLNVNEAKTILEDSKPSVVCSICQSRRPESELQRKYTYEELEAATEGFSIKYSLCEGEYGPAFRGHLENNSQEIVIKQHAFTSLQEQKVFMSELQLLRHARHENVTMLLGSCIRLSQFLIVYEKACNGSLDQYLTRKSGRSLTWGERMKVAIGVAKGLKYLHENNIVHGGIKPSNILLNHEFKPLVGDFVFGKERYELKNLCKQKSRKNCGYTAPECQESGELSAEADVFSFGVVLVELITGHMIAEKMSGQKCLVECVRSLLEGRKYLQLVDPKVSSSYDEQELASLVHVAENCMRKNPKERFTMNMVVSALPCVLDSNSHVKEHFSSENSNVSDLTNSKDEDLDRESSEERKDNITCCNKANNEKEVSQECCDSYTKCGESSKKKTEEKESKSSTNKVCQKWEGCLSYQGAREFYLQGTQEFTACEEFFGWCDSI